MQPDSSRPFPGPHPADVAVPSHPDAQGADAQGADAQGADAYGTVAPDGPCSPTTGPEQSSQPVPGRVSRLLLPGAPGWVVRVFVLVVVVAVTLPRLQEAVVGLETLVLLVVAAMFVSFALEPAVSWLGRHGWSRGWATGVTMGGFLLTLGVFGVSVGATVVSQSRSLLTSLPERIDGLEDWLVGLGVDVDLSAWSDRVTELVGERAVGAVAPAAGVLFQLATVAFFAFYFTVDGPRLRRGVGSLLRPHRQVQLVRVWELAVDRTGRFILSRGVLAVVSTVVHATAFSLLKVDGAIVLGIWVGVISQLVPVLGTYLAAALPVLFAFADNPSVAIAVLGVVVVYQQLENYVLAPRVQASMLDVHPAVGLAVVLVGSSVFGAVGTLLALPAAATVQAFVSTYVHRYELIDELTGSEPSA